MLQKVKHAEIRAIGSPFFCAPKSPRDNVIDIRIFEGLTFSQAVNFYSKILIRNPYVNDLTHQVQGKRMKKKTIELI